MQPHPRFDEIKERLQNLASKGKSFSGVCYRCTDPRYLSQITSGIGSQLHGARWTPKNSFPSVYLCETPEAALQEYLARGRRMRIPDHKSLPMVMAGVKVKAANLLDITEPGIATAINEILLSERIHWRAIQDRREAVSQAIGRAIHEICFSGLIAASHVSVGNKTIVLFPQKFEKPEVLHPLNVKPLS
jgi:RES domain-containing protein